ncbi:Ataxin-10 [Coemansia sp. RSA 1821]|nr:Ataxin-10 [Coemansia sp. RSA 1086]KAJ1750603.1 Ataxin-10 [Coemansia sp. RSA 1821]
MELNTEQAIYSVRQECAALKDQSPHPSRPQVPKLVAEQTWLRIHLLFDQLISSAIIANSNEDMDIDPLAPMRSEALADLCVFVRNATAMDPQNQTMAMSANVVDGVLATIRIMLRCEMTYAEAKQCSASAGQALSNLATNNYKLQAQLIDSELTKSPIESIFWYLLSSFNSKTQMSGLMLILNTVKNSQQFVEKVCLSEAGHMLMNRIGEMFGETVDDSDEKAMMYVILSVVIEHGYLSVLLTSDPELEMFGVLNALAVYCNENAQPSVYARVLDTTLLNALSKVLAKCHTLLQQVWQDSDTLESQNDDSDISMDSIMAAHRSLSSTASVLSSATTDMEPSFAARVLKSDIPKQIVALLGLFSKELPRIEKANQPSNTDETSPIKKLFMFKCELIQIIGNIAYKNKAAQDMFRELDGLALVLDHMRIDENHPFIREYAVVALRSLLNDNKENQAYISSMDAQNIANDYDLNQAGIQASLQSDGRVSINRNANT